MGKFIAEYEIVSELGRGGMGVVYKAREASLNRFVAIKMLGSQMIGDESLAQRFLREARAVADLNHPNLVQVFRVDTHEDQPYFVMEFVEGESLKALIERDRRLPTQRAFRILGEVAAGLAAAHDKGVIHRDIKPENIMLTRYGGVKVVDFGIARVDEPGTRLTTTGMGMGTPNYLSPEVCLSQPVDQRSDIFSLGVVLFEMLTGTVPFSSDSPFELMTKVVEARVPDIRQLNPDVDEGARTILAKMIAKRPKLRYQNCHALIGDIEDYLAGRAPRWAMSDPAPPLPVAEPVAAESGHDPAAIPTTPMPVASSGDGGDRESPAASATVLTDSMAAAPIPERRSGRPLALVAALVVLLCVALAGGLWAVNRYLADPPATARLADSSAAEAAALPPGGDEAASGIDAQAGGGLAGAGGFEDPAAGIPGATSSSGIAAGPGPLTPVQPSETAIAAAETPDAGRESVGETMGASLPETPSDHSVAAPASAPASIVDASEAAPAPETSGDPDPAAGMPEVAAVPDAPGTAAEGMSADPQIAVLALGDRAITGILAQRVREALRGSNFEVRDEALLEELAYAETLAGMARAARNDGVDVLVIVDLVATGERQLQFYGRSEIQRRARIEARVVDLHRQRNLGAVIRHAVEYVPLTAEREADRAARTLAATVLGRLRALRAVHSAAGG